MLLSRVIGRRAVVLALSSAMALVGTLVATRLSAQAPSLSARLDQFVQQMVDNHRFNGAILVLEAGKPIINRAVGVADFRTGAPLTTTSLFNLAEASQPFTAIALLQLKEQGKLSLDDELTKYIPELRAYSDVTLRHLLTHTSGIPSYEMTMAIHWEKNQVASNRDMIRVLTQHSPAPEFRPGERYQSSPTNYALLATVVERVSGKDFAVYCLDNLFSKAGMTRTYVHKPSPQSSANRVLAFRSYLLKGPVMDDQTYLEGIVGDKNVLTCTEDLILWEQALNTNLLLKPATLSENFVAASMTSGASTHHGFAWNLPSGLGRRVAEVDGQLGGFGVVYTRLLDEQHTVIVLSNNHFARIFHLADGCYNLLTGLEPRDPKIAVGLLLSDLYSKQGLTAAVNRYNAIRNNSAQRSLYDIRESELNVLGHELIELGKVKDAIEFFKLNADAYPRSFNVYDSLAEAYMIDGQKENAVANYKKSLMLYPDNVNAATQLRKLEGKK